MAGVVRDPKDLPGHRRVLRLLVVLSRVSLLLHLRNAPLSVVHPRMCERCRVLGPPRTHGLGGARRVDPSTSQRLTVPTRRSLECRVGPDHSKDTESMEKVLCPASDSSGVPLTRGVLARLTTAVHEASLLWTPPRAVDGVGGGWRTWTVGGGWRKWARVSETLNRTPPSP